MASVGLDLGHWSRAGLLRIVASRPAAYGLERHLAEIHRHVAEFDANIVVIDPASALTGQVYEIAAMLGRLIDHLKTRGASAMLTALTTRSATAICWVAGMSGWQQMNSSRRMSSR